MPLRLSRCRRNSSQLRSQAVSKKQLAIAIRHASFVDLNRVTSNFNSWQLRLETLKSRFFFLFGERNRREQANWTRVLLKLKAQLAKKRSWKAFFSHSKPMSRCPRAKWTDANSNGET